MSDGKLYIRLCRGVADSGILVTPEQKYDRVTSLRDWYESIYYYNQQQYDTFQATKSVRGMKDVVTNKLVFDFDNEVDPDYARQEARTVIYRLEKIGINRKDIEIYFSGNKGFNIILTLDRMLTTHQTAELATKFANDLKLDLSLYDCSQILRIPGTKHQKSGLYKVPLTYEQFFNDSIEQIKTRATSLDNVTEDFNYGTVSLPEEYFIFTDPEEKKKPTIEITGELTFVNKPKNWRNCKWSLLQGNFKSGERDHTMMILGSTCRALGFDKETTYYMCKSALKKSWAKHGQGDFSKEELWNNIIENNIFTDRWTGGQYSCKSDPWLKRYCEGLGEHRCQDVEEEKSAITVNDMDKAFTEYASEFEKNVIKTGIEEFDNNVTLLVSTVNGLLGQPGAGKTSVAINFLKNTSIKDTPSMFFSLDMGVPIVYSKLVQKETGLPFKEVLKIFKEIPETAAKFREKTNNLYKNVSFCYESGLTVADMSKKIKDEEERTGRKIKLVIIDYLECIAGPYSDTLANTGFIANQLKDMANELSVCILLLLQTQKHSTPDISDPLLSLKAVKGSSVIEQSMSAIVTLWREGYNPYTVKDDKYISFAVVKNRFGSLWKSDFSWDGLTGNIKSLAHNDKRHLDELISKKKAWRKASDGKIQYDE